MLWDYSYDLRRTHPGSTVIIDYEEKDGVNELNEFKRIYVCLKTLVNGFHAGCRKLIGLDGCHTKGIHRQQILTAVSIDANNGWWPLAWAVVEQENQATWAWFLNYLQLDLRILIDPLFAHPSIGLSQVINFSGVRVSNHRDILKNKECQSSCEV